MIRIAIRVDASLTIGSGHVMRCLALANYLAAYKAECLFLCGDYAGNMNAYIQGQGFLVVELPASTSNDASVANKVIADHWGRADWLVVDHYQLASDWESTLRDSVDQIMVIDDLANRSHDCDVLLDQGRASETAYADWVNDKTKLLIGPKYALLRPDFLEWRKSSYLKRQSFPNSHGKQIRILISLGGSDIDNYTQRILNVLTECFPVECFFLQIIVGSQYQSVDLLKKHIAMSHHKVEMLSAVNNMAELMTGVDLVIGAAGISSWERCSLGVPAITLCVAENQRENCQVLAANEAAFVMDGERAVSEVAYALREYLTEQERIKLMVNNAYNLSDGLGCHRVGQLLLHQKPLEFVEAKESHKELTYQWQIHPDTRRFSLNKKAPTVDEHNDWFEELLQDENRRLFFVMVNDEKVGLFRLDFEGKKEALVSILIAPEFYGQGLATQVLTFVKSWWASVTINATVLPENIASYKAFKNAGFLEVDGGFVSKAL